MTMCCSTSALVQVAIRRLDDAGSASDEIIRAKFVVGADGEGKVSVNGTD